MKQDLLDPVRKLLSSPGKWLQCDDAKTQDGTSVYPKDAQSVCWCLESAIEHCYPDIDPLPIFRALKVRAGGIDRLYKWNDAPERTFEDIQKLLAEPLYEEDLDHSQ